MFKNVMSIAADVAVSAVQMKYGVAVGVAANAASRTVMRPDESVQGMTFARALDMCMGDTVEERLRRLEDACRTASSNEECAALANERLGRIGVYLQGEVSAAFSTDVGAMNIRGKKVALGLADTTAIRSLVRTASDFKTKKRADSTPWCEVWVRPRRIVGVWVAESLVFEEPSIVEELEERGYSVEVVSDGDIIKDGVGTAVEKSVDRPGMGRLSERVMNIAMKKVAKKS